MESLDSEVSKIMKNFNKNLKVIILSVTDDSNYFHNIVSSSQIAGLIKSCVNSEYADLPGTNEILPCCMDFFHEGIFDMFEKVGRKGGEPKYFFSLTEQGKSFYKPLAKLALSTIHDSKTSFFHVFSSYGGGRDGRKGAVNRFRILRSFFPESYLKDSSEIFFSDKSKSIELTSEEIRNKTGINQSTLSNSLNAFYKYGIIETDGQGISYIYKVTKKFPRYFEGNKTMQKMLIKFRDMYSNGDLHAGMEFSSPELYKSHFYEFSNNWFNHTIRDMAKEEYLEKKIVPKKCSKIRLTLDHGEILGQTFVVPLERVLTGRMSINELSDRIQQTPFDIASYVRTAVKYSRIYGHNNNSSS